MIKWQQYVLWEQSVPSQIHHNLLLETISAENWVFYPPGKCDGITNAQLGWAIMRKTIGCE